MSLVHADNIAHWIDTLENGYPNGMYDIYMWYKPGSGNDESYINVYIENDLKGGCAVDQSKDYPPDDTPGEYWQKLECGPFSLWHGDRIDIVMNANHKSNDTVNDTAIADAIKLVHVDEGVEIIIDNEDPGFYTSQDETRSYYSMQDDGGQSKAPFYVLQACHINLYTATNCLGNLYAMGHNGLTSIGASSSDFSGWAKEKYINALNNGDCFGEAFRKLSQWKFSDPRPIESRKGTYSLLGAGTLQSKAYIPYYDYVIGNIHDTTYTNYNEIYVKDGTFLQNNVTVNDGAMLKLFSGKDIIITPEFLANYGSKLDLQVKPYLY
jgi:hypothetical protein